MPFSGKWRDYQSGDLLYGLAGPRNELASFFGIVNGVCTIDQYDIFSVDRMHGSLVHDVDFISALNGHSKYNTVLDYDLADNSNWTNDAIRTAAIAKRKCKGGLNWITQNTGRHIHFLLAGMDMEAVPNKNFTAYKPARDEPQGKAPATLAWDAKERSITGAELRWIYRNRSNLKVQQHVQFWKQSTKWGTGSGHGNYTVKSSTFVQCPPPWGDPQQSHSVRNAWAGYIPTRVGAL
jgi:hypothetical protein